MGRLIDQLWADARHAELSTKCRRGGVAARLGERWEINGNPHCSAVPGACGCQHAEAALLIKALREGEYRRGVLLTTLNPCTNCAHLIIESELVTKAFYLREYRDLRGIQMLRDAGIETRKACDSDVL